MIFVIRSVSGCFYDVATHAWRGAAEQGTPIRDRLVADRIASALGHMRAEVVPLKVPEAEKTDAPSERGGL